MKRLLAACTQLINCNSHAAGAGSPEADDASKGKPPGSLPAEESTTDSTKRGDDVGEKLWKVRAEALRAIEICYRTCFAAVLADVVVTAIDGGMWSKFFGRNGRTLGWVDFVDIFESFSQFSFGWGLWHMTRTVRIAATGTEGQHRRVGEECSLGILQTMTFVWGISAFNFALVSVSMAAALPTHCRDGPFHFLSEVSSSKAAMVAGGALLLGAIATNAYCEKTAYEADLADNKRISLHQQKSKANIAYASNRQLGYRAYRNQGLCVMTFGFNATLEMLKWAADANAGVVGRLFSASDVGGPFVMAWALVVLNRAFLRAAIARLRAGADTNDAEVFQNFFVAQTGFYKRVSETMKDA